jgi:Acetyltransferase (GNAT) domain
VQKAMEQGSEASFVTFLLTLDGEPIADMFNMEGARHTEGIIASFSARLARLSPRLVLYEYII